MWDGAIVHILFMAQPYLIYVSVRIKLGLTRWQTISLRLSSSSSSLQVFLERPKQQRHHEDHYSQSKYSSIRQCCSSSGISMSSNGAGRLTGMERRWPPRQVTSSGKLFQTYTSRPYGPSYVLVRPTGRPVSWVVLESSGFPISDKHLSPVTNISGWQVALTGWSRPM